MCGGCKEGWCRGECTKEDMKRVRKLWMKNISQAKRCLRGRQWPPQWIVRTKLEHKYAGDSQIDIPVYGHLEQWWAQLAAERKFFLLGISACKVTFDWPVKYADLQKVS